MSLQTKVNHKLRVTISRLEDCEGSEPDKLQEVMSSLYKNEISEVEVIRNYKLKGKLYYDVEFRLNKPYLFDASNLQKALHSIYLVGWSVHTFKELE